MLHRVETGALISYQDYHMLLLTLAGLCASLDATLPYLDIMSAYARYSLVLAHHASDTKARAAASQGLGGKVSPCTILFRSTLGYLRLPPLIQTGTSTQSSTPTKSVLASTSNV